MASVTCVKWRSAFVEPTARSSVEALNRWRKKTRSDDGFAWYREFVTRNTVSSKRCLLHIQSLTSIFLLHARRKRQSGRMSTKKGVIGILTGGGDVPGLNPAIRAVTIRALREGYQVVGIRRGWLGVMSIVREKTPTTATTSTPDRKRSSTGRDAPAERSCIPRARSRSMSRLSGAGALCKVRIAGRRTT